MASSAARVQSAFPATDACALPTRLDGTAHRHPARRAHSPFTLAVRYPANNLHRRPPSVPRYSLHSLGICTTFAPPGHPRPYLILTPDPNQGQMFEMAGSGGQMSAHVSPLVRRSTSARTHDTTTTRSEVQKRAELNIQIIITRQLQTSYFALRCCPVVSLSRHTPVYASHLPIPGHYVQT